MERCPAVGWRWQAQPEAHSPRPHPEMTTVRPSSRILPTWKTDGLRLLVTESSPRQSREDRDPCARVRMRWTRHRQELDSPELSSRDLARKAGYRAPSSGTECN